MTECYARGQRGYIITIILSALVAVGCGGRAASWSIDVEARTDTERTSTVAGALTLEETPVAIHRRVADFAQKLAGPTVRIGAQVVPFYRPGIVGVAYYHFSLFNAAGKPSGFVVASAGGHDFPIVRSAITGPSLTAQLRAAAGQRADQLARYYLVDAASLVAEDRGGKMVAKLGNLPPRIHGERSGRQLPKLMAWESWDELKRGYTQSYGALAKGLQQKARPMWRQEQLRASRGQALLPGESLAIPVLRRGGARVEVMGDGAELVTPQLVDGRVTLSVEHTPHQQAVARFSVSISYESGATETLDYGVLGASAVLPPDDKQAQRALAGRPVTKLDGIGTKRQALTEIDYDIHWADGASWDPAIMLNYRQLQAGEAPNFDACRSRCAATAWAMLFGWLDRRAAANDPQWATRDGIFRAWNQRSGADAIAPLDFDQQNLGWWAKLMTIELRDHMKSSPLSGCNTSGDRYTHPSLMFHGAAAFLLGGQGAPARSYIGGISLEYNTIGAHQDGLRQLARAHLLYGRRPVVVGEGWFTHYSTAFGYMFQYFRTLQPNGTWAYEPVRNEYFIVNKGAGRKQLEASPANTWFAGTILPGAPAPADQL